MSALVLNAWWGSRLEGPDVCALRLQDMLRRLAVLHPVFGCWRRKAKTKEAAQQPFCSMPPVVSELAKIIEKTGERDVRGRPLPELGYWFYAWNELDANHSLSFSCRPGRSDNKIAEPNTIKFSFGKPNSENRDLMNYSTLKDVLIAVGQSWDVNWGTVEPWAYELPARDPKGDLLRPWSGWLTYLSPAFASQIRAPAEAIRERLSNGSLLIGVTKDQFDPSNPSQVAVYNAIEACLKSLQA